MALACFTADITYTPPSGTRLSAQTFRNFRQMPRSLCLVENGSSLAIDTGSTSGFIAQALRHKRNLCVVTNSVFIASTLSMIEGNRVFMAGTQLRNHDGAAFDKAAFDVIERVREGEEKYEC